MKQKETFFLSFTVSLLLLLGIQSYANAQWIEPSAADLEGAWEINVNQKYTFERSPIGFGNIKEFGIDRKRSALMFFREERNTVWTTFEIPYDGVLLFDVTPYSTNDDYDWMLFEKTDTLAKGLLNKTVKPTRSNNARNDLGVLARTGMQYGFENLYEKPGIGMSYSKPLEVTEGQKFFLIIDNIYPDGKGFDLKIEIAPKVEFNDSTFVYGVVTDKTTKQPLKKALISLEDDETAFIFKQFETDSLGKYRIKVPINRSLNLTASKKSYLFSTEDFDTEEKGETELNFALDSIQIKKSINFYNIHFPPNSADILPTSMPDLDRMLQFLIEHENLKVKIIGHSNTNVWANQSYLQKLSMKRAVAVKNHLVSNGIDESRLSCLGMGGKKPIVVSKDINEARKNLRVELEIAN